MDGAGGQSPADPLAGRPRLALDRPLEDPGAGVERVLDGGHERTSSERNRLTLKTITGIRMASMITATAAP